jgi:hypothetical protein
MPLLSEVDIRDAKDADVFLRFLQALRSGNEGPILAD